MNRGWGIGGWIGIGVGGGLVLSNLLVSLQLGLGDAEALYYCYGRHLQLSYLDHPPLIGWLLGGMTSLAGPSVVAVRVVSLGMTLLAVLFTYRCARDLYGARAGAWSALLLLGAPVFAVGMTAASPDAPLVALWSLVCWQLGRAAVDVSSGRWARWGRPMLIGIALGLAFLAKYTGACLTLGVLLCVLTGRGRAWLKRPGFWLGALCALALSLPVFVWNADHDWIGWHHRLSWTQTGAGFSVRNAGALLGGQLLYVGPVMLPLLFLGARQVWRDRKEHPDRAVVLAASIPALIATYLLVLWSDVAEPHWPAAGYLPLFAAAAGLVSVGGRPGLTRAAKVAVGYGVVLLVGLQLAVLTPLLPATLSEPMYQPRYDLANELRGWPEVAEAIRELNPERRPVLAGFYTQCSQLTFALSRPEDPPVRCISPEIDDFDVWHGRFELDRQGAFFVTDNRFDHDPASLLPGAQPDGETIVEIRRGGRWVRRFSIVRLKSATPMNAGRTPR